MKVIIRQQSKGISVKIKLASKEKIKITIDISTPYLPSFGEVGRE